MQSATASSNQNTDVRVVIRIKNLRPVWSSQSCMTNQIWVWAFQKTKTADDRLLYIALPITADANAGIKDIINYL